MKKIIISFFFLFVSTAIFSQADTLYLQKNKKIACKILEINDTEIRYKIASNPEGPLYVIDKSSVNKYTLANGFTELLLPDELSLENEHKEIIGNRQVIKLHPFSIANNQISLAYEKVIKVGMNIDAEAGYINSELGSTNTLFRNSGLNNSIRNNGFYFKPGIKFFLGQDFSVKGLKYAHPLKGRYIKLDLAVSYINFEDLSLVYYGQSTYPYQGAVPTQTVYSNLNSVAYGGFVNYGRQFILGNILTMDYYIGAGFTGQTQTYSNPDFFNNPFTNSQNYNYNYYGRENTSIYNYHGFLRIPNSGLSFTAGFRIGYIIPDTKAKNNRKPIAH